MNLTANIVIGTCLRKHRKKRHLSQRELAELMGKPQSFVSKIETGERKLSVEELYKYTMYLADNYELIVEEVRQTLIDTGCIPS